jgi:UDP-3-O-[3-hydroxymyristoyl] glucosamine N-acyltransferase
MGNRMLLSDFIKNENVKLFKDGNFDCLGLATENFLGKKILSFCASEKYLSNVLSNDAVVCLALTEELYKNSELPKNWGIVLCDNPKAFYFRTHNLIAEKIRAERSKPSVIDKTAVIHKSVVIPKNNVTIGKNVVIEPNTVINEFVTINDDVKIGPNNVLGGPAFQFFRDGYDVIHVESMGELIIEKKVETQSSCSIDNGIFKTARIGENTKIDSYAQIAHDFICGKRGLIMAHAVISGRVTMGDDVYIGPSATVVNGLNIGDRAKASIGAVVTKNIEKGQQVSGNFAIPHKKFIDLIKSLVK